MTEIASTFLAPNIDLDSRTPENYPFVIELGVGDARFLGIGTWHFTRADDRQFPLVRDILARSVGPRSEQAWIGLNEGSLRDVDSKGPIEAALQAEADPGMLTWHMKKNDQPVASWDLSIGEEVRTYLDDATPLPSSFHQAWQSKKELGEWLGYHEWEKMRLQWLMHREKGIDLGDPDEYASHRLEKHGAIQVFEEYGIDVSEARRREIHIIACEKAGLATSLPFDPREAHKNSFTTQAYRDLHFAPTNVPSDDYYAGYTRLQRLGSISGNVFRNIRMADVLEDNLVNSNNVVAVAGGGHIVRSLQIMHERQTIPMNQLEWHIGEAACAAYIEARPNPV